VTQSVGDLPNLDDAAVHEAICYLLVGASQGELRVTARVRNGIVDALEIQAQDGFGGFIWDAIASALVGVALQPAPIRERLAPFERAGLIPHEINLAPLVSTLVKMGK
jgi:hypothetical protein